MKKIEAVFLLLLLTIGFLPSFNAIDKMSFQWLFISVVVLFYIIYKLLFKPHLNKFFVVYNNSIVAFISLFFLSLFSIFSSNTSLNLPEFLIEISRLFLILSLLFVFVSITMNLRPDTITIFKFFNLFLLLECLYFFGRLYFVYKQYGIVEYRGVASNVNIQSFSILIKLPLLLYSFRYIHISKFYYYFISTLSISIIFLISSRAALLVLSLIFLFYIFSKRNHIFRNFLAVILPTLFSSFFTFLFVIPNLSASTKLTSLSIINQSTLSRISFYKEAITTIFSNPLYGIGFGNWKIFSIFTHREDISSYTTPYFVHNDFLQIGAEAGIISMLAYISFLLLPIYYIFKLRNNPKFGYLLISVLLSLFVYLADSFFNFPINRPLIQVQFLLIISLVFYFYHNQTTKFVFKRLNIFLCLILLSPVTYSSFLVYDSYVKQNFLLNDFKNQKFTTPLSIIEEINDQYPNITATGLPIKALKANYYQGDNDSIIDRLLDLSIKDNPFIKYSQALKSIRFKTQGVLDSSLYYARDAFNGIPNNELHIVTYMSILTELKDSITLDSLFESIKSYNSINVWNAYLNNSLAINPARSQKRLSTYNEAVDLFPTDDRFSYYKKVYVLGDSLLKLTTDTFNKATLEFDKKNYLKSAQLYMEGSKYDPEDPSFLENASHAFYLNNDKTKATILFDSIINHFPNTTGKAHYLKGLMLVQTYGELEESCRLFKIALKKGNPDAEKAINLFCK